MYSISRMFYRWGSVLVCSLAVFGCETKTPRTNSLVPNPHSRANLSASPRCALAKRWLDDAQHSAQSGNILAAKHRRDRAKKLCPEVPAVPALPAPPAKTESLPKDWLLAAETERERGNMSKYRHLVEMGIQQTTLPMHLPLSAFVAESYFKDVIERSKADSLLPFHNYGSRQHRPSYSIWGLGERRFLYHEKRKAFENTFSIPSGCIAMQSTLDRQYLLVGCNLKPRLILRTRDRRILHKVDNMLEFSAFSEDGQSAVFQEHDRVTKGKHAVHLYPLDSKRRPWSVEFSTLFPNQKYGERSHINFVQGLSSMVINWGNHHLSVHALEDGKLLSKIDVPKPYEDLVYNVYNHWLFTTVNPTENVFVWNMKQNKTHQVNVAKLLRPFRKQGAKNGAKRSTHPVGRIFGANSNRLLVGSEESGTISGWVDLETTKIVRATKEPHSEELPPAPSGWITGSEFYLYGSLSSYPGPEKIALTEDIGLTDGKGTTKILFSKGIRKAPILLASDRHHPKMSFLDRTTWEVKTVTEKDGRWQIESKKLGSFTKQAELAFYYEKYVVVADEQQLIVMDWKRGTEELRVKDIKSQRDTLIAAISAGSILKFGNKIPTYLQTVHPREVSEQFATLDPNSIEASNGQIRYRINEDSQQRIWDEKKGQLEIKPVSEEKKQKPSPWVQPNKGERCTSDSKFIKIHRASSKSLRVGLIDEEGGNERFFCIVDTNKLNRDVQISDMSHFLSPDLQSVGFYSEKSSKFPDKNVFQVWGTDGKLLVERKGIRNAWLFNDYVVFWEMIENNGKTIEGKVAFVNLKNTKLKHELLVSSSSLWGSSSQLYSDKTDRFLAWVDSNEENWEMSNVHVFDMKHGKKVLSVPASEMIDSALQTTDYWINWRNAGYKRPFDLHFVVDANEKLLVLAQSKTVKVFSLEHQKLLISLNVFPKQDQGLATYPDGYFELFGKRDLSKTAHHLHCLYGSRILPLDICQPWLEDAGRMALTFQSQRDFPF
jgi:hypothetical protein